MPESLPHAIKVTRLRRLSHLLDKAIRIPGTNFRIGLDPLLGLIPGGGDTITGALSAYIIFEAARMGLPRNILGQMIANVLVDSLVGSVPVVGDLFDVGWKANVRNIALLERHLHLTPRNQKVDRFFLIGLIAVLIIIVIGFTILTVVVIQWLWQAIA